MAIFGIIVGALLILAALLLELFWHRRHPSLFDSSLFRDPIGTIVILAFEIGMSIGGVYLIVWSVAH